MNKNKIKGIIGYIILSLLSINVIWDIIQDPKSIVGVVITFIAVMCGMTIGKWINNINRKDEENDETI